jgi:cytolysin (calcineurin-like family phosphatase)
MELARLEEIMHSGRLTSGFLVAALAIVAAEANADWLSRGKPATGSIACNANEGPAKAVNGSTSGGNSDKFCSAVSPSFLQVDLTATYDVSSVVVKHAGAGGESTSYNTAAFNIQLSTDGSTWTTVATTPANTASTTTHVIPTTAARYARLNVTDGAGGPSTTTRIYELEVHGTGGATPTPRPPIDVTFYVVSDTHADPPESYDLRAMARAINAVAQTGTWPTSIGGMSTGFKGGAIGAPRGVVFTGDLMGWGVSPTELLTFRRYFEKGRTSESILFPGYVGLGNHDVDDADRSAALAQEYRKQAWAFVDSRHKGAAAPVPATRFDAASHAYSWDLGGVHFIQGHRFPGDTGHSLPSSLPFLSADLRDYASDGRPVFIFHHYGMDAFGTQDRWWTASQRTAYRSALNGYNVAAIFAGHSHVAMQYAWQSLRVFQANNAKAEIGSGNRDGNGSFAIVRLTTDRLDVVTCRWLDDAGRYELIAPFYSGAARAVP